MTHVYEEKIQIIFTLIRGNPITADKTKIKFYEGEKENIHEITSTCAGAQIILNNFGYSNFLNLNARSHDYCINWLYTTVSGVDELRITPKDQKNIKQIDILVTYKNIDNSITIKELSKYPALQVAKFFQEHGYNNMIIIGG